MSKIKQKFIQIIKKSLKKIVTKGLKEIWKRYKWKLYIVLAALLQIIK